MASLRLPTLNIDREACKHAPYGIQVQYHHDPEYSCLGAQRTCGIAEYTSNEVIESPMVKQRDGTNSSGLIT
jgi:hypothetical protein